MGVGGGPLSECQSGEISAGTNQTGTVTFPVAFAAAPSVMLTAYAGAAEKLAVSAVSSTQFTWKSGSALSSPQKIWWLAYR